MQDVTYRETGKRGGSEKGEKFAKSDKGEKGVDGNRNRARRGRAASRQRCAPTPVGNVV